MRILHSHHHHSWSWVTFLEFVVSKSQSRAANPVWLFLCPLFPAPPRVFPWLLLNYQLGVSNMLCGVHVCVCEYMCLSVCVTWCMSKPEDCSPFPLRHGLSLAWRSAIRLFCVATETQEFFCFSLIPSTWIRWAHHPVQLFGVESGARTQVLMLAKALLWQSCLPRRALFVLFFCFSFKDSIQPSYLSLIGAWMMGVRHHTRLPYFPPPLPIW